MTTREMFLALAVLAALNSYVGAGQKSKPPSDWGQINKIDRSLASWNFYATRAWKFYQKFQEQPTKANAKKLWEKYDKMDEALSHVTEALEQIQPQLIYNSDWIPHHKKQDCPIWVPEKQGQAFIATSVATPRAREFVSRVVQKSNDCMEAAQDWNLLAEEFKYLTDARNSYHRIPVENFWQKATTLRHRIVAMKLTLEQME